MKINTAFLTCKLNEISSNTCKTTNGLETLNSNIEVLNTLIVTLSSQIVPETDIIIPTATEFNTVTSGLLTIGEEYEITDYLATDDFTNVGAASNANGVIFTATGTTPTDWAGTSELTYGLENTPVTVWDASIGFTSDPISFVGRDKNLPWAVQTVDYNITPGTPELTIQVTLDGTNWTNYSAASTSIDMTDTDNNAIIFDSIAPFEYMRLVYVPGGSTGDFSMLVSK